VIHGITEASPASLQVLWIAYPIRLVVLSHTEISKKMTEYRKN